MNKPVHAKFGMGAPLRRIEDASLITGKGHYTDDWSAPGMLHGYVLRSPHANARFTLGDLEAARSHPGVHLVLAASDIGHLKPLRTVIAHAVPDEAKKADSALPILCEEQVRHVGDAIAFIVADSVQIARDASELIEVDFEPFDAVVDTFGALSDDAPLVYPESGTNVAFNGGGGDAAATQAVFADAPRVSEVTIVNNRVVSMYLEPRSCLAEWVDAEDRWSVVVCSQGAHGMRGALAGVFGVAPDKIRVRTPDVGGGFGTKVFPFREYPLAMEAARRLGRPVKWTSDRTEHFMVDSHGRDNVSTARMAMDDEGRFLALDVHIRAAMGAYLHYFGPMIPNLGVIMSTGVYDIPAMVVKVTGIYTNTTPVDAYRGAGRPEASYLIERLVEQCASDMGLPREEIRRRNFIKPEQMPYKTAGGRLYDTGEFDGHLTAALERAGWADFDTRAAEARSRGKVRGIGFATYVEACAFAGSEPAFIELQADGSFILKIGTQSNGQGHATAYAQLAAEKLGIDYEKVFVHQGDTDELEKGGGTGGSRSVPLGGVSAVRAGEALADKLKKLASDKLEASAGDIELVDGEARIAGTDRAISFADLAASAPSPDDIKADGNFEQAEATYPNGTHICEVEIDPDTGVTEVIAYTIVDDFGVTVNPILLAGQVHGGVVQGIGQALHEQVVFDDDGQLLTATLMDYAVPRADTVPSLGFETRNVPSTTNVLGIKGAGEAGSIGSCAAVMNAVNHALRTEYGAADIDMPATPIRVWQAIQASKG
ncbi:MAG: xanthine dehydrogenase family protein molybdopterin-binding subunit [Salaquimonas sp.]|nr:xanthine dehydrogenase family protein molybdopterin-binding subunit [Salaquimonas sp.]